MMPISHIKDTRKEKHLFMRRVIVIALGIIILSAAIIARLVYLQIYQHQLYITLARQNQQNLYPVAPPRGLIYDRNGVLLAENIPVYNLVITPNQIGNLKNTINELSKIITISHDDLRDFKKQEHLHRRFQPLVLRTRLTEMEVARFAVNQYRFPGVSVEAELIRHYPLTTTFAQAVGFVGRINAKELNMVDPINYSATNFIGKTGIEKFYETQLHGTVGYQQAETNARGQIVRVLKETPPIPGNNLYLTIDSHLQAAAETILADQRGAIVAINPNNGDLLALVSTPSFDPNLFVDGISKKDYDTLQNADGHPLYNRALQGKFPAGSTVKPLIASGALASGAITPAYTVYDPGWFQLKGSSHIYHGFQRRSHGVVDIVKSITVSSDVFFYNVALRLGIEKIANILNQYGYGEKTNIDISGETNGVLPTPAWKQKTYHQGWYPGDTLNVGIGQGYLLVTPMQLAQAVAAIAKHGQRWQPHVLLRSQSANGSQQIYQPISKAPLIFEKKIWDLVSEGMLGVTASPGGTAYPFFRGTNYTVAGKTGTAQVYSLKGQRYDKDKLPVSLRDNSLFIAYAPVDNPQIAVAVIVQNGTTPAAQVARQILDTYFNPQKKPKIASSNNHISDSEEDSGNEDEDGPATKSAQNRNPQNKPQEKIKKTADEADDSNGSTSSKETFDDETNNENPASNADPEAD